MVAAQAIDGDREVTLSELSGPLGVTEFFGRQAARTNISGTAPFEPEALVSN
jgi:hypothetical protein